MNQNLRFGVGPLPNMSWDELVRCFRHIEELGLDSALLGDHFVNMGAPQSPWFEGWTTIAALAARTARIRIGMGVTPITWRHPAFLARQALTVDHISNGRLELGLGTGLTTDPGHAMTGIPNWSPRERVERFREYVEVVDQLLRNEVTTYKGRFYELKEAVMNPRPIQKPRPPIMIAAFGPTMLKYAARYADTWSSVGNNTDASLEATRKRNELLDRYCEELGREPHSLRRSLLEWEEGISWSGGLMSSYRSEENFREMVGRFVDVGITEFHFLYPAREEQLPIFENIAREVIPEFKERFSE
ncbi:MAG: LLM class flavin-dependent oxidoreductase [Candidatus Hodarchaeales archaeon]|jgi:alkanesulfonate monooxygenase SsuD/methylene tetrahydromethanopterin reductase-like flavin-dependent oxidoreductase (luciferase family)